MYESLGGGKCKEALNNTVGNTEEYATLGLTVFIQWNRINNTTNVSRILREKILIIHVVSFK
jgi:hypothetical protein